MSEDFNSIPVYNTGEFCAGEEGGPPVSIRLNKAIKPADVQKIIDSAELIKERGHFLSAMVDFVLYKPGKSFAGKYDSGQVVISVPKVHDHEIYVKQRFYCPDYSEDWFMSDWIALRELRSWLLKQAA